VRPFSGVVVRDQYSCVRARHDTLDGPTRILATRRLCSCWPRSTIPP